MTNKERVKELVIQEYLHQYLKSRQRWQPVQWTMVVVGLAGAFILFF